MDMLAKLTSRNRLTLPKSAMASLGPTEYFDVEARDGVIVLTPVRFQRGDTLSVKLAALLPVPPVHETANLLTPGG